MSIQYTVRITRKEAINLLIKKKLQITEDFLHTLYELKGNEDLERELENEFVNYTIVNSEAELEESEW